MKAAISLPTMRGTKVKYWLYSVFYNWLNLTTIIIPFWQISGFFFENRIFASKIGFFLPMSVFFEWNTTRLKWRFILWKKKTKSLSSGNEVMQRKTALTFSKRDWCQDFASLSIFERGEVHNIFFSTLSHDSHTSSNWLLWGCSNRHNYTNWTGSAVNLAKWCRSRK